MLGALLLGGATALLVSCGSSNGLLSSGESSKLSGDLDAISQAVSAGHCNAAQRRSGDLRDHVNALPNKVDSKLLKALQDGAVTVGSQAAKDCTNPTTTQQTLETQTQTTPTTTTPPVTTPTNTVPTTPTNTTPTTPTETTPPPTGTTPNGGAGTGDGAGSGGAGG
jgi:cell division septation protein DedD